MTRRLSEGALEAEGSGFVSPADCGVGRFQLAADLLLGLHTRAAALARCARLLQSAYKLSALGGEQLLALLAADSACGSLVGSVFGFARRELSATSRDCEGLHGLLLRGHLAMRAGASSWFSGGGFEQWSQLFSFASTYKENVCAYAHRTSRCLDRLSERFAQLSSMEIQRQLDAEARYFQSCALATLHYYGEAGAAERDHVAAPAVAPLQALTPDARGTPPEQFALACPDDGPKLPFHRGGGLRPVVSNCTKPSAFSSLELLWLGNDDGEQLLASPQQPTPTAIDGMGGAHHKLTAVTVELPHLDIGQATVFAPKLEMQPGRRDAVVLCPTSCELRGWDR